MVEASEQGFPDFPVRDLRRMFRVLVAMDKLGSSRLTALVNETGYSKQNILDSMKRAGAQLGVEIEKDENEYRLTSWGPALNKSGVKKLLRQSAETP